MSNCTTFLDVNRRFDNKPAIIYPDHLSLSHFELFSCVCGLAQYLTERGIRRGDRICIYLDSTPEFLLTYLALWRIAAIAVPLNRTLTEEEVRHIMGDAGTGYLIAEKDSVSLARRMEEASGCMQDVIFLPDIEKVRGEGRAEHCSPDTICQLQYTSGTTGAPKGAMLSHANWMAALDAERELLGFGPNDVYLGIYPMSHVGVSWGIAALKAGASWVVMERFELEKYLLLIEEYHATVVASMPPVIHSLTQTAPGTEKSLASVRALISGGGPLHPAVWKTYWERFRIPIVNAYGLSETLVVGTGTAIRPEDYDTAEEFRSVGMPVGYSEVRIVDVDRPDQELAPGETGEIALRGPGVASGYWNMPEATAAVFLPDGWFLTGDIGHLSPDGMLSITDRKKDMIVMSGWKIYPTEVEKVLIQHPKIRDVAVFGVQDERRGEIPVAAIVLEEGGEISFDELEAYSRQRLAGYKVPRKMVVVESLPRVHGWKLLRRVLREQFQ